MLCYSVSARAAASVALLPFDTLLLPLSLEEKYLVAHCHSLQIQPAAFLPNQQQDESDVTGHHHRHRPGSSSLKSSRINELRIGFLSYDFNDHPTAHLVEGIFQLVKRWRENQLFSAFRNIKFIIFSYGKDDSSEYRHRLQQVGAYLASLFYPCN